MSGLDIRDQKREALILKSIPYKEQDRLLTLLSPEHGVEKAIARGAAKANSSLRPVAQPYCQVSLLLSPAKGGISFLREGLPLRRFLPLNASFEALAYGAYFSELSLSVAQQEQPAPELYGLLMAAWTLLQLGRDWERTARFFELRLLASQGLLPELGACQLCGGSPENKRGFLLCPEGQLLCQDCYADLGGDPSLPRLSPGTLRMAQSLLELPLSRIPSLRLSPSQSRELEQALAVYLEHHLEYAPKARKVLRQLSSW